MAGGILVWSERPELTLELLGQARRLADDAAGDVFVTVLGEPSAAEVALLGAHGADVVYSVGGGGVDPASCTDALSDAIARSQPRLVLVGATKLGMEVAPRVAERSGAAYAAWAIEIEISPSGGDTRAGCVLYAGAGLAKYRFRRETTLLTAAQGVFAVAEAQDRVARVEELPVSPGVSPISVLEERPKATTNGGLAEAKIVVDVGRGVREREDLEMIGSLVSLLAGQLACSRPIASERDWLPTWLGLSGHKVKPELCLTIGVSGAVQHVVGIRDARLIAAVNNDEDAAIFAQADIGIVADLYDFLPALIKRLEERAARPRWT